MKRVLLLHREDSSSPFRARFDAAFIEALRAADAVPIDLYEESIESERFPGAAQSRLDRDYLKHKYADRKIDVIVAVGDTALSFARQNREMFGNPPIVAVASLAGQIEESTDNVTGLQGGLSFGGTIELALALRPDVQRVYVVHGSRDHVWQAEAEFDRLKERSPHITLEYLRDLPLNELVKRVAAIPDRSIVLFLRQTMRDEKQDLDPFEGLSQVVRASHVPVFSIYEQYAGQGIVGGYMWRYEADAQRLARMALRIANGESTHDVPYGYITNTSIVDWRQLQRWNIPELRLPVGSLVQFRTLSFFEEYRRYVVGGLLVFAVQLVLIGNLLFQRMRRRRAEEQTRHGEERYKSVVDTQSELICRFLPDSTLTFVNDAYCRFWNKRRDELIGRKFVELIPPEARQPVLDRIGRLHRGMDSQKHEVILPDGTVGWHYWINHAILDERGHLVELQGVGCDITDRVRAEQAVEQLEARNSAMLRAIPDLMFVLLRDGTYVDYHARDPKLLFVPPGAFVGRKVRDIMPPDLADTFMTALERAAESNDPVVVEYELQLDERRSFEARIVKAGGDRLLSMVRDVTESKRSAELNRDLAGRLIASQEVERQRIARELHDDLSQKIALLNIEIDQLAVRVTSDGFRSRLQQISAHTGEIASDLHNLSHQLHPSKLESLGLQAALEAVCRDISQQSGVQVLFTHGILPQKIDPNVSLCLYRIVQEALHNVARHSQAQEAQVRLTRHGDSLTLQVADPGVGFDPQAEHAGLGLISMRERVAFLRGKLSIHAHPGGGTRVDVRVPLMPSASSAPEISQSA